MFVYPVTAWKVNQLGMTASGSLEPMEQSILLLEPGLLEKSIGPGSNGPQPSLVALLPSVQKAEPAQIKFPQNFSLS